MKVCKGEKFQDVEVEMFLRTVFICSMEYLVCAASLIGKEISEETKWSYEKVEIAACAVGRAREVCSQYVTKVLLAVGGNKLWSFMSLVVLGRGVRVSY